MPEKTFTCDEKMECLLDVWLTFSCANGLGGRWAGGLSTLEEVEMILFTEGWIDDNGNPEKRESDPAPVVADVCHACGKPWSEHSHNRVGHEVCP